MHDAAYGLRRILLPRTPVNKGKERAGMWTPALLVAGLLLCPRSLCLNCVRDPGYVLAVVCNGVVVVGCNHVFATTAVDRVRSAYRLLERGVDCVIVCSTAHEIRALLPLQVIGTIFTVELVSSGITDHEVLEWPWVGSAMELIGSSGTCQYVVAVPAEHQIYARIAVAGYRQRSEAIVFGEDIIAGATVIRVVAVFTVQFVVPRACPEIVSGGLCI